MSHDSSNPNQIISVEANEAVKHLKQAVAGGKPWHIALLEAIGLWTWPEESHNGHFYCYLIDGEAFDWLLLAERLSQEIADVIPEQELLDLIFFGRLPQELSEEEFKALIGSAKYHAYLNYLYGVTVEKFVLLAVEEEIHKESHGHVFSGKDGGFWDSYQRLYGTSQETLLQRFRDDKDYPQDESINLDQLEEFTYWLFKYRLGNCDKEMVASDTRKGVEYLESTGLARGLPVAQKEPPSVIDQIF